MVPEPVPGQEGGGEEHDGEENPVEHLRHVELLRFGGVHGLRIAHAESCHLVFTSGLSALIGKHGAAWLGSHPNLAPVWSWKFHAVNRS